MAVNFDFEISENYGYVFDFDKVKAIIRNHELQTTTKYSSYKASGEFGHKGKAISRIIMMSFNLT